MDKEEILGEIVWLKNDIVALQDALHSEVVESVKTELKEKISADKREIKRLEKQQKRSR